MVTPVRVEATISAQNKLRPGLAAASAELSRFRAMQTKATTAFTSTAARMGNAVAQRTAMASAAVSSRVAAAGRNQIVGLGGPAVLAASYKQYADVDRQITNIGVTADASAQDLLGVRKQLEGLSYDTALSTGKVTKGLDVLVAQGRSLKEGLQFLPAVARTAAAANAEVEDIAKSADAVASNFKLAGSEVQKAFDIMAAGGKAGQFELKDMAQFLPSLAPAAAAAGFSGTKGLTDLVSMLQIMRKGSGSSGEAMDSMSNVFQKMESEETQKKFKKFGVDLAAGMAKGRKEGRNLVEVFEELTGKALKGDLSKLPQLFTDTQFARGMRALMTYRGEWQKLATTISSTADGTVSRDLLRVTNDARAQLDRMFSAVENRAVQLGGILAKNIVLPLDESIKKIEQGKNPVFNRVEEYSRHHNADAIANGELNGDPVRDYDENTRRLVDARKEFLQRSRLESERQRLGGEITANEGKKAEILGNSGKGGFFDWIRGDTSRNATDKALSDLREKEKRQGYLSYFDKANKKSFEDRLGADINPLNQNIDAAKGQLAELNRLSAALDDVNLKLAENQAARADISKPTMGISQLTTDVAAMAEAGRNAGRSFREALSSEIDQASADVQPKIARLKALLSFTAKPTISIGGAGGFDTGKQGAN
jgi:TP901 family phage tail tape measure protein